jgi:iron(III) transport system permease protein
LKSSDFHRAEGPELPPAWNAIEMATQQEKHRETRVRPAAVAGLHPSKAGLPGIDKIAKLNAVSQQGVVRVLLLVVVAILVGGPLVVLLHTSLLPSGIMPLSTFVVTPENYLSVITQPDTWVLLRNTFWYAGGSVLLSVIIAGMIAWLTERTDAPMQGFVRIAMFAWLVVPPLVLSFGWILLLNPGNGALNVLLRNVLNLDHSVLTIYSVWAMIFITGLSLVPTTFVMLAGILRNMDARLESAGAVSGANRLTVIRKITIPLLSPGLASTAIYLLMVMIQHFDLPLVIGLTARFPVLSTRIYLLSTGQENALPNYGLSAAYGVVLMLFAALLMWFYFRIVRYGERFRVVTGKAFRPQRIKLGAWRAPVAGFLVLYFVVMFVPLLILLWTSLFPFYRTPSFAAFSSATLSRYREIFGLTTVREALGNTLMLVFGASSIVMVLATLISWYSVRTKSLSGKLLDFVSFLPIAIPGIVMALAILTLYVRTPLYGSVWVLIIAHVTIFLAFGTRTMNAALLQVHKELENAAAASGASWTTVLRHILVPLLWPQFLNGWLWIIANSARDLTVPLMLMARDNLVLSSLLLIMWQEPNPPEAAALSIMMVAGLMVIVVGVQMLGSRGQGFRHKGI